MTISSGENLTKTVAYAIQCLDGEGATKTVSYALQHLRGDGATKTIAYAVQRLDGDGTTKTQAYTVLFKQSGEKATKAIAYALQRIHGNATTKTIIYALLFTPPGEKATKTVAYAVQQITGNATTKTLAYAVLYTPSGECLAATIAYALLRTIETPSNIGPTSMKLDHTITAFSNYLRFNLRRWSQFTWPSITRTACAPTAGGTHLATTAASDGTWITGTACDTALINPWAIAIYADTAAIVPTKRQVAAIIINTTNSPVAYKIRRPAILAVHLNFQAIPTTGAWPAINQADTIV